MASRSRRSSQPVNAISTICSAAGSITSRSLYHGSRDDVGRLVEHYEHDFSDRFIAHMLSRNIRVEEDLVDQLLNSSEKRLARTLLLLARSCKADITVRAVPRLSQETLAEMIGTTRSRVNFFMNKFRRLGFIEDNGGLKINNSLLSVVLHRLNCESGRYSSSLALCLSLPPPSIHRGGAVGSVTATRVP